MKVRWTAGEYDQSTGPYPFHDLYVNDCYVTNLFWYQRLPIAGVPGWRTGDGMEFEYGLEDIKVVRDLVLVTYRMQGKLNHAIHYTE